ncbi:MAG: chromate transporter [Clostridiales bacterium]|nr:chromate transporter [Clostridiales bacterium]
MICLQLFYEFFKMGLFAIGGGLATIPFLQQLIGKYGWFTSEELVNMIAISESTPGAIGVNMATYVGFQTYGILGAVVSTVGLTAPSVIVIIIIAHYFKRFAGEPIVEAGFYGLRPAVTGLIGAAGFEVARISLFDLQRYIDTKNLIKLFDLKAIILFGLLFFLTNKYEKHPILYIILAGVVGVIFKFT